MTEAIAQRASGRTPTITAPVRRTGLIAGTAILRALIARALVPDWIAQGDYPFAQSANGGLLDVVFTQQGAQRTDIAQSYCAFGQTDPPGIPPCSEVPVDAFADQSRHGTELALRKRQPDLRAVAGGMRMQRREFDEGFGKAYLGRQL